jgi:hypothetical protein
MISDLSLWFFDRVEPIEIRENCHKGDMTLWQSKGREVLGTLPKASHNIEDNYRA